MYTPSVSAGDILGGNMKNQKARKIRKTATTYADGVVNQWLSELHTKPLRVRFSIAVMVLFKVKLS